MTCIRLRLRAASRAWLIAAAGVLALAAVPARAQTAPAPDAADLRPAEIQRLFDAYLVMEAQRTLGLSDAQFPAFLTKLRALQDTRRRQQQARTQLLGELGRMTGPRAAAPAGDSAIRERLAALDELESRSAAETRRAYGELDALLEPRQQARFRVFEDQIERRKLELILRARQNARQNNRPRVLRRQ